MIVINFILESSFHIKVFNLLHGFFLSITCLGIFMGWLINIYDKNIMDNYRIYVLIIVKIVKTLLVKIMDFQMPLLKHLAMLSPFRN